MGRSTLHSRIAREIEKHGKVWELKYFFRKVSKLLGTHGLDDWDIFLDSSKRRAGMCDYEMKRLYFSMYFILNTDLCFNKKIDVVLHEIAHALVGPGHDHDNIWRQKALDIGSSGNEFVEFNLVKPLITQKCNCSIKHLYRPQKKRIWCKNVKCICAA